MPARPADPSCAACRGWRQGNPFADPEAPGGADELALEDDPDLQLPPGARAKEKLRVVLQTIQVRSRSR